MVAGAVVLPAPSFRPPPAVEATTTRPPPATEADPKVTCHTPLAIDPVIMAVAEEAAGRQVG